MLISVIYIVIWSYRYCGCSHTTEELNKSKNYLQFNSKVRTHFHYIQVSVGNYKRLLIYTRRYITNSKEKCHPPEAKSSTPSQELASTYRTRKCNTVFTIPHRFYLILGQRNSVHHPILFPAYPFYYHLHIYAYFFQVISVLRGSPPKACLYFFSSHMGHMACLYHSSWFDDRNYIYIYIHIYRVRQKNVYTHNERKLYVV